MTLESTQPLVVTDGVPSQASAPSSVASLPMIPTVPVLAHDEEGKQTFVVAPRGPDSPPPVRRPIRSYKAEDVLAIVGAAASGTAITWLLFEWFAPLTGFIGAVVVWYVVFLAFYALAVRIGHEGPAVRDKLAAVAMHTFALLLLATLGLVIGYTLFKGWEALPHLNFFTQDMRNAGPLDGIDVGGILHAIVGTLIMISIALLVTIPLGITCAVFLSEMPGRFSLFVRTITEAMTALPSIVAGLFIYATLILTLGFPKSGFAAAMALSVMMLPIIIRASDVVLRLVPGTLKEASYATGAGQWRTVWHVVLPTARSGLTTAVILGTARGIGETSPVLLTAGFTAAMNTNPFSGPMVSLPLATFEFVKSPQQSFIIRGFGTAAVLLLVVLILFVAARLIGGRGPGDLSKRTMRRRDRQSAHDLSRFEEKVARAAAPSIPGADLEGVLHPGAPAVVTVGAASAVDVPPAHPTPATTTFDNPGGTS